jgi:hypothetical protein
VHHRVGTRLSFSSSRRNWDSHNPSPVGKCAPPLWYTGGRGTLAGERGGGRVPILTMGHTLWYKCTLWLISMLVKQQPSLGQCELATQSPDCPSSDSFNMDIQTFIQHQQRDKLPFFSQDDEVNDLVSQMVVILFFCGGGEGESQ